MLGHDSSFESPEYAELNTALKSLDPKNVAKNRNLSVTLDHYVDELISPKKSARVSRSPYSKMDIFDQIK